MRYSRDGGANWTNYVSVSLGDAGEYRTLARWRALGLFDQPGALFDFKFTGDARFRCSGVVYNESMRGVRGGCLQLGLQTSDQIVDGGDSPHCHSKPNGKTAALPDVYLVADLPTTAP